MSWSSLRVEKDRDTTEDGEEEEREGEEEEEREGEHEEEEEEVEVDVGDGDTVLFCRFIKSIFDIENYNTYEYIYNCVILIIINYNYMI